MVILSLIPNPDQDTIKTEIGKLNEQIQPLRARIKELENEIKTLNLGIKHYQGLCKHEGQQSGRNDYEGDWSNPCPNCGEHH